jgi:hypothetical protein
MRLTIGGLAAVAVAIGATSMAAAAAVIKGSSGPLTATLTPSTHTPKINTLMPISVTATLNGKPAHATAAYQFLYGGAVVAPTQYPYNNKHFSFTGHFSDKLNFPASSLGFTLTLRVVIKAAGHTVNLPCSITSHK